MAKHNKKAYKPSLKPKASAQSASPTSRSRHKAPKMLVDTFQPTTAQPQQHDVLVQYANGAMSVFSFAYVGNIRDAHRGNSLAEAINFAKECSDDGGVIIVEVMSSSGTVETFIGFDHREEDRP